MCYEFFISGKKKKKLNRDIALNLIDGHYTINDDGYFYGYQDNHIRTLDFFEYIDCILDSEPQSCLGHLRQATNGGVSKRWIHGWVFNDGWYCCHNGIINFNFYRKKRIKEFENDSYTFFYNVFLYAEDIEDIIENVKEVLENDCWGSGVFFLSNFERNKHIFINFNKNMYLKLINRDTLVVSNEKIETNKFYENITIRKKESNNIDIGILKFSNTKIEKIQIDTSTIKDIKTVHSCSISDDCILVFDSEKFKFMDKIKIDTKKDIRGYKSRWWL